MEPKRIRSHEELQVWKLARSTAVVVYRLTATLPAQERFGLQAQMRRAAVSVVSNIAEGAGRSSTADFCRFIAISLGSLAELETQSLLCEDLGFLEHNDELYRRIRGIRLMLTSLQNSLRTRELSF
jgi:four helix bundle protein